MQARGRVRRIEKPTAAHVKVDEAHYETHCGQCYIVMRTGRYAAKMVLPTRIRECPELLALLGSKLVLLPSSEGSLPFGRRAARQPIALGGRLPSCPREFDWLLGFVAAASHDFDAPVEAFRGLMPGFYEA